VNDKTISNETRLGAAADLALLLRVKEAEIGSRHILVVAGDTLFLRDFNLELFLTSIPSTTQGGVVYYDVLDPEEVRKRGIIEVDENTGRILRLLEKPSPDETASRKACPAFYAYKNACIQHIFQFMEDMQELSLEEKDAPGRLLAYLIPKVHIHAVHVSGRFDIGNLAQYKDTLAHFAMVLNEQV
jgi:UTP-glucose-1-phosphate uridylyltransferase